MEKLINTLAYIGTASMIAAPWVGENMVLSIIVGLVLMTPQAIRLGAWNLVLLNLAGIVGYIWRLL